MQPRGRIGPNYLGGALVNGWLWESSALSWWNCTGRLVRSRIGS